MKWKGASIICHSLFQGPDLQFPSEIEHNYKFVSRGIETGTFKHKSLALLLVRQTE
jgi:hypothetical protein